MAPSTLLKLPLSWLRTLKARLMLASVLVIAASVLTTASVLLERVERRSEQAVLDLESSHIEQTAALLGQRVVLLQRMMRAAAERMPEAAATDADEAIRFLGARTALMTTLDQLFVADTRGRVVAVHDGQQGRKTAVDLAGNGFLRGTLDGLPVVSEPMRDPFNGEPVVVLTMPVLGHGHRVVAMLGGTMRLNRRNLLDDLTVHSRDDRQQATTLLTDARGTIVAHPQASRLLAEAASEPLMAAAVARWVTQGRPVEPSAIVWRAGGHFTAIVGVPGPDWVLFRVVPDRQLLGGIDEAHHEAMALAAGVAVAGGGLILALLTLLLHPLARLRERLARLDVEGGVDEDWPRAAGEIGELGAVLQRALRERAAGERHQRALMAQLGSVMAAAPIGIAITRHRQFELISAEWCALLGWPEGALVGRSARDVFASHEDYDTLGARVLAAFLRHEPYAGEHEFRRRDGSHFWGRLTGRPVDGDTPGAGTIWLLEDATHQRAERERLAWSARHDGLTRLLNRAAFEERLRAQIGSGTPGVLLALDLDHFKQVNDAAGHAAGDRVLRDVAALLLQQLRGDDAAARLGGDEFALLMSPGDAAGAMALAQHLCEAVARLGVVHQGRWLGVGASIGVAEPVAGATAAAWQEAADSACYAAKRGGRGRAWLLKPGAPSQAGLAWTDN
ncbi:MAG: diguanylate cyclase [Betaproteobacteria bacterium]